MKKGNIDPAARHFYFALSGDDGRDGTSQEIAKRLPQSAIAATATLTPPPDINNTALVSEAQGGVFPDSFVLPGFVNFDAPNATFFNGDPVTCTVGSAQVCRVFGLRNTANGGAACRIADQSLAGVQALFAATDGTGARCFEITGNVEGIFVNCDRLSAFNDNDTIFFITASSPDPIDIDIDVALLVGDNSTFMDFNPPNPNDVCVVNASSIHTVGATQTAAAGIGTMGYRARSGHLTVVSGGVLHADTVIYVHSGAEMDISQATVGGDIVVEAGGVLNVNILDHEYGTITNNGVINGRIGAFVSKAIATGYVNDNLTVNAAIVNGVFSEMTFGTGGNALVQGSETAQWTLVDDVQGIWEYTGTNVFRGTLSYHFITSSAGAVEEFRFKWEIDPGSGYVDLPDPIETLVAVGNAAQSVSKTCTVRINPGDRIRPRITRIAGASDILIRFAVINITD